MIDLGKASFEIVHNCVLTTEWKVELDNISIVMAFY